MTHIPSRTRPIVVGHHRRPRINAPPHKAKGNTQKNTKHRETRMMMMHTAGNNTHRHRRAVPTRPHRTAPQTQRLTPPHARPPCPPFVPDPHRHRRPPPPTQTHRHQQQRPTPPPLTHCMIVEYHGAHPIPHPPHRRRASPSADNQHTTPQGKRKRTKEYQTP